MCCPGWPGLNPCIQNPSSLSYFGIGMLPAMDLTWETCRNLQLWAGSRDWRVFTKLHPQSRCYQKCPKSQPFTCLLLQHHFSPNKSSHLLNAFSKANSPPSFLIGQRWLTLLKILLEKEQSHSHWP